MNGYLLVNKPKGPTSHDVVMKMRKIFKTKKVGHTGTLDPLATGLMVILIGKATKAADYITHDDKAYIAELKLGVISDTLDITGELTYLEKKEFSKSEVESALLSFIGESEQIPPMYSAKKIDGKKLYELARKGISVERKAVTINIPEIKILEIDGDKVKFYVHCSKGTYIRSLIDDFGKKLGYGAVMTSLKRVLSGNFSFENDKVYTIEEIENEENPYSLLQCVDKAFYHYPKLTMNEHEEKFIKNGIPFDFTRSRIKNIYNEGDIIRVYNEKDEFFALMEVCPDNILKLKTTFYVQ